jgi:uncharacterized protein YkwD
MRRTLAILLVVAAGVPATAQAASPARLRASLLTRLNHVRIAHHLPVLRLVARLNRCAARHTRYLAQIGMLTHDSRDGTSAATRIRRAYGARVIGETLAYGDSTGWIVSAWLHSAAHRAILLDPTYRVVGLGAVQDASGTIWATADLGS